MSLSGLRIKFPDNLFFQNAMTFPVFYELYEPMATAHIWLTIVFVLIKRRG